ncbi:hypothetical protein [Roseobacter ponti]|uniref:Uncharacterized protein n=1 Tax=Roseobacter ponti TaxID=1891787 RepID=A0A858SWB6_9RHOB|nr:hypothetical protein [Roseobacter ponti]QJF52317.1 hypothetical protein G3256_14600 [Roseobacter ponti]
MSTQEVRDTALINKLVERDGTPTIAVLEDGEEYVIFNIVYGYDLGDEFAHITTNFDPQTAGASVDFFFTNELTALLDGESREPLFSFPL